MLEAPWGEELEEVLLETIDGGFDERLQVLGHVVERTDKEADFIACGRRQESIEIALGNRLGTGDQILDRRDNASR